MQNLIKLSSYYGYKVIYALLINNIRDSYNSELNKKILSYLGTKLSKP